MSRLPFRERLAEPRPLLADGAIGSLLLAGGLKPGECPERMNLDHPEVLAGIAAAYLEAGAQIIQTNTFGGSPLKLAAYGLAGRAEEINARGIDVARGVVADRAYLAASCGPSGRLRRPFGDATEEEIFESFRRQIAVFAAEGVDLVIVETMTDLGEAELAVRAARAVSPHLPVAATMTFDPTPRGFFTMMGDGIESAAARLGAAGADLVGSNCGNGIRNMVGIAAEFRKRTGRPILVQANAGLPALVGGATVYGETPEFMAGAARELATLGVKVIGGCCGTTPAHIAALRKMIDGLDHSE